MHNEEEAIQKIWNYMKLGHILEKVDAIIAFGSYDPTVGCYAAKLFLEGYAPLLILSGGQSDMTKKWDKSEAEIFLECALEMGVPRDKILVESESSNSGENITFTKDLLEKSDVNINKAIIVQKPFMERRVYATLKKQWSDLDILVTSPPVDFDHYVALATYDDAIGNLVGDLERIKKYPDLGFQIHQDIPDDVWSARCEIRGKGYCEKQIEI